MEEGGDVHRIGEQLEMFANNALHTIIGIAFVLVMILLLGFVLAKNYVQDSMNAEIRAERKIKWKLKLMKFKQREVAFFKKIS